MRIIYVILVLAIIGGCSDERRVDIDNARLADGTYLVQTGQDKYYRVFHIHGGEWWIYILNRDGDKFEEIGRTKVEKDGTYIALYDVEFRVNRPTKSGSGSGSPLRDLPGYALVMENGKISINDCQVRINGIPTSTMKVLLK